MIARRWIAATLLLGFTACTMQDDISRQVLQPPAGWLVEPADLGLPAERFELEIHSDASLTGWFLPHENAGGRTVVLLHAENVNASALHPYYTFLHDAGFNVLVFDPRGYGQSAGEPSLRAWTYDLRELFEWLGERPDVDRDRIALYGTSMGSVAAMFAARMCKPCRAVVFEHLPSLRDMLRENVDDPNSFAGAYSVGLMEFASLPQNIEPSDNAARAEARALFVATENELARNRRSLMRAYGEYAGEKQLWVLPETGQAPHALLTHGEQYRARVVQFLDDAFAGRALRAAPTASKVRDTSDGEAWYEVTVEVAAAPTASGRVAVEACALLADGTPRFARSWADAPNGNVRIKLPEPPVHVSAWPVPGAVADDDSVFTRPTTDLMAAWRRIAPLWPLIEAVRSEGASPAEHRELAEALTHVTAEAENGLPQLIETELSDVFVLLGLSTGDNAWLDRALAAVPEHPNRHFWPGPVATYGYPQAAVIERAKLGTVPGTNTNPRSSRQR